MSAPSAGDRGAGPPLAFATCALIWGSTFLVIRVGNDTVPPVWAATLRLALASVILVPLAFLTGGGLPTGRARVAAALYGTLVFGVNFPLLYWGETAVSSGLTAVLYATIPLSSALYARAFGLERIRLLKITGALVALAGVAAIFGGQIRGAIPIGPFLAVLAAATTASLGTVLLKRGPRQPPIGANAVGALVSIPICYVASLVLGESQRIPTTASAVWPIVYLAVAGSVGAFVAMSWLVNRWPVTRVSFISVVTPLVALALGAAVRREPLSATDLLGSVLVIAGVLIAIESDRRHPAHGSH